MADDEATERDRGLFHHKKKDETPAEDLRKESKHHKHLKHVGETVAASAAAYAVREKFKAKSDPENAKQHKRNEKVALAVAAGASKIVLHEKHKGKEAKEELKEAEKKHHHIPFFGSRDI